jgi:hypothetical protein
MDLLLYMLFGSSHRCHRAQPENARTLNYGPPFWYVGDLPVPASFDCIQYRTDPECSTGGVSDKTHSILA